MEDIQKELHAEHPTRSTPYEYYLNTSAMVQYSRELAPLQIGLSTNRYLVKLDDGRWGEVTQPVGYELYYPLRTFESLLGYLVAGDGEITFGANKAGTMAICSVRNLPHSFRKDDSSFYGVVCKAVLHLASLRGEIGAPPLPDQKPKR